MLESIVASILGGGMTGILGVMVQRIADFYNKKLDLDTLKLRQDHEVAMRKADAEILEKEYASRVQIVQIESDAKEAVADSQAFAASFNEPLKYSEGNQSKAMLVLDFIRGVVRPGLTIYLCVLTTVIYFQARSLLGIPMEPSEAYKVLEKVINTVLYLSTTTLLWWFGVRNKQSPPRR